MLGLLLSLCAQVDLEARYPHSEAPEGLFGHATTAGLDDVYRLSEFGYRLGRKFEVECGPASLVVGHGALGAMWAVVLPDEPGSLSHGDLDDGETFAHLYLRFPGDELGDLVPEKTIVEAAAEPSALFEARAIFAHKINGTWQVNNRPSPVWARHFVFDADTPARERRVVMVDEKGKQARYEPAFAARGLPRSATLSDGAAGFAFDTVADAFDKEYAMFGLVPELDWEPHVARWREAALGARDDRQLAAALGCLLEPLRDGHVSVGVGGGWVPVHSTDWWLNASYKGIQARLGELRKPARNVQYTRTAEGLGYVLVDGLGGNDLTPGFDEALEALSDTWGLILDLRFNGGGDELIGREVAGRFLERKAVYAKSRYRAEDGGHAELGPWYERALEPRGPWTYASPVLVLQGPRTMSSAEGLVWMLRQGRQVETFGSSTQGSSANPRMVELPQHSISVRLPRWLASGPAEEIFEKVGIAPDVPFEAPLDEYDDEHDPLLEAAIEHLEDAVRKREREPGKRG